MVFFSTGKGTYAFQRKGTPLEDYYWGFKGKERTKQLKHKERKFYYIDYITNSWTKYVSKSQGYSDF